MNDHLHPRGRTPRLTNKEVHPYIRRWMMMMMMMIIIITQGDGRLGLKTSKKFHPYIRGWMMMMINQGDGPLGLKTTKKFHPYIWWLNDDHPHHPRGQTPRFKKLLRNFIHILDDWMIIVLIIQDNRPLGFQKIKIKFIQTLDDEWWQWSSSFKRTKP